MAVNKRGARLDYTGRPDRGGSLGRGHSTHWSTVQRQALVRQRGRIPTLWCTGTPEHLARGGIRGTTKKLIRVQASLTGQPGAGDDLKEF